MLHIKFSHHNDFAFIYSSLNTSGERAGWRSGNALDSHSGGSRFEFRPKMIMNQKNEGGSYHDYLKYRGLDRVKENNKDSQHPRAFRMTVKCIALEFQYCHYIHWLRDVLAKTLFTMWDVSSSEPPNTVYTNFFMSSLEFLRANDKTAPYSRLQRLPSMSFLTHFDHRCFSFDVI
jgi:hypothetical protein